MEVYFYKYNKFYFLFYIVTVYVAYTVYETVYVFWNLIYIRSNSVLVIFEYGFADKFQQEFLLEVSQVTYTVPFFSCIVHLLHFENLGLCIVTVADLFREPTKMTTCEAVPKMPEFAF